MQLEQLRHSLESPEEARALLEHWHLRDAAGAVANLRGLAAALGLEAFHNLCHPLGRILPRCPDPDMSLNNLERFLTNPASQPQLFILNESRNRTLETLLQLFSTSQFFSDLLITNPDYLEMLRIPLRSSPSRAELQEQLREEVNAAYEDSSVLRVFRRFRQKQILRIGANDIIR